MFRPIFHKQLISCIDEIESAECRIANPGMVLKRSLFTLFMLSFVTAILFYQIFMIPGILILAFTVFYTILVIRLGRVMDKKLSKFLVLVFGLAIGAAVLGIGLRTGVIVLWNKFGYSIMQKFY